MQKFYSFLESLRNNENNDTISAISEGIGIIFEMGNRASPINVTAFHGAGQEFNEFNEKRAGIWFTSDYDISVEYADPGYHAKSEALVYKCQITMSNPLVIDVGGGDFREIPLEQMAIDTGVDEEDISEMTYSTDEIVKWANSKGYDGVAFHNIIDAPFEGGAAELSTTFCVFSNSQIKILDREVV